MIPCNAMALFLGMALSQPCLAHPHGNERMEGFRQAALKLKEAITQDPTGVTKSWNGPDVCKFKGFFCDKSPDNYMTVASIDFNQFRLGGPDLTLDFLESFPDIALFHANSNGFRGELPSFANHQWIYELDVSNNKLSGQFPQAARDREWAFFDIRYNGFSGPLAPEFFTKSKGAEAILLNDNQFTGPIPETIGESRATELIFANNHFSGPLPQSLGNNKALNTVLFLNNEFSGPIPESYGGLVNLTIFDATNNRLSGPVPESLCKLPHIKQIHLEGNKALSRDLPRACRRLQAKGKLTI